ncbi:MAG TPA: hypothetical protein VHQ65_13440 [Thermoanaerobaculia bacterium]|nr:hypothetical protein [Thermoanaerobaculia bacterium]
MTAGPARAVTARAWCRVDFAGGTLDIWPLGLLHRDSRTVNVAIDLPVEATLSPRAAGYRVVQGESSVEAPDLAQLARRRETALPATFLAALEVPPVDLRLASASPVGGGLGGSSALGVALLAAGEALLGREPSSAVERAAVARDLEARLMSLPTGTQDHFPALLGGALDIRQRPGGVEPWPLAVDVEALAASLVVVYTGRSHFSAGNNWQIVRRRLDGDPEVTRLLTGIAEVAAEAVAALPAGDLPRLGELMSREWALRRRLAAEVDAPAIRELLAASEALGAWGGKACGAGGGGSVALLCPPERRAALVEGLGAAGWRVLAARPTAEPLRVEVAASADPGNP